MRSPFFHVLVFAAMLSAVAVPAAGVPEGSILEALVVEDLEGRRWEPGSLAGKVVLVDFWATWCAPCLAEVPHLKRAYERYSGRGFEILGVSLDQSSRRQVSSWLLRQGVSWPQVHDGRGFDGPLARRLRVAAVPRSFLIDRAGRLIAVDLRAEALEAVLAALFPPARFVDSTPRPAAAGDKPGHSVTVADHELVSPDSNPSANMSEVTISTSSKAMTTSLGGSRE